jgi:prepilin-type N-terminal cleavage/methylation domain-containing protein
MRSKTVSGFTLIELSIVLVIIGLIIGSIVVGQDLIHAAQLRSLTTQYEKYRTATQTFINLYNCVPGDCANATDFFGQAPDDCRETYNVAPRTTTCNGNGDGYVGNPLCDQSGFMCDVVLTPIYQTSEPWTFWQQLSDAGLISGQYTGTGYCTTCPFNHQASINDHNVPDAGVNASGTAGVTYTVSPHLLWMVWSSPIGVNTFLLGHDQASDVDGNGITGGLIAADSLSIDTKIDDGNALTGTIRTRGATSVTCSDGSGNYTVQDSVTTCALDFINAF